MEVHRARNRKVVTLEVKLDSNVNGVREQIADHRNADTATTEETRDMQPEDLHEDELNDINKESYSPGRLCQ